jgi:hypothetical protein
MNFSDEPEEIQEPEQPEMDATSKAKLKMEVSRTLAVLAKSLRETGDLPPDEEKEGNSFK